MGFRIHTAIGWGMPFEDFVERLALPDPGSACDDGWYDHLEKVLDHTRSMPGPKGLPIPITGPGETVLDLMKFVGYDTKSDVVLMPTISEARIWHRRDDDLDYALLWGPRGPADHEIPLNRVEYLSTGFHPYGRYRMDAEGNDVPRPIRDDLAEYEWERDPDLLPGLPPTLRHWTLSSGVLDRQGIARLRPIRAIWWS